MRICAKRCVELVGEEGLGEGLDAGAVVAGEGAEVALQGDAAGGQGAEVGFLQDAQVALRVGQQRGVTRGEDGVEQPCGSLKSRLRIKIPFPAINPAIRGKAAVEKSAAIFFSKAAIFCFPGISQWRRSSDFL